MAPYDLKQFHQLFEALAPQIAHRRMTRGAIASRIEAHHRRGPRIRTFCKRPSVAKREHAMTTLLAHGFRSAVTGNTKPWYRLALL